MKLRRAASTNKLLFQAYVVQTQTKISHSQFSHHFLEYESLATSLAYSLLERIHLELQYTCPNLHAHWLDTPFQSFQVTAI